MKKLSGYFLMISGILLISFALLIFFNGSENKESLFRVLALMFGGIVSLFSGISFTIPALSAPEKVRNTENEILRKPRF